MGKYQKFRGKYPAAPVDLKWQGKVNLVKNEELKGKTTEEVAAQYNVLRARKKKIEEELSDLNIEIAARVQTLTALLESSGLEKIALGDGSSFSLKDEVSANTADKVVFHKWLQDNKLDDLRTVHYSTLGAFVRTRLEKGESVPPGVKVYSGLNITWRSPKDTGELNDAEDGE